MKKVYTCFCTDVIHEGHLNILRHAKEYGQVVVGMLTDAAMVRFNRFPTVPLEVRIQRVKETGLVDEVVVQEQVMYDEILDRIRPDYVIHGDNWKDGPERIIRENVIACLERLCG